MIDLRCGDCLEVMKDIDDNSVNMVLTSPPYDNLRTYNRPNNNFTFDVFKLIANEITRVLAEGGVIVWIVNDATINGSETLSSFKQALYFKENCGLNIHDTMIWQKNSFFTHKNRYIPDFEYMFVISKGVPKTTNIIQDRKNKCGGTKISGNERKRDGSKKEVNGKKKGRIVKEYGSRYNVWDIPPDRTNKTEHPAVFPLQLATDHIISWSNENDVVLDPLMGSGTTGVACKNLNRNFIGIELDENYFNIAKQRIDATIYPDTK